MIDLHKDLVASLTSVLPSYHELVLKSQATPCISYMELDNYDDKTGDTLGYSKVRYQVKVWDTSIKDIQKYSEEIDTKLRALGFKRVSSGELHDYDSALMQKIMTYEAFCFEIY